MTEKAALLSTALSTLPSIAAKDIETVADYLGFTQGTNRFLVTDEVALIIYDSRQINSQTGHMALFPEVMDALSGQDVFYCRYEDGAFVARAAVPIMLGDKILGAVCFYDYDTNQANFLMNTLHYTRNVSIVIAVVAIVCIALVYVIFGKRIRRLLEGIGQVRAGKYDCPIELSGRDEFTVVSAEFNDLAGRLQRTEQVRREFVSDASHELKTPLAAIKLLSDSVLQTENIDPADMREFLSDISEEIDRLTRITEKLLVLTRLDAQPPSSAGRVDLAETVRRAVRHLSPLAGRDGITVCCDLKEGHFIKADADGAYQVVFNLVENAIKYNQPDGSVYISVTQEGDRVRLSVENTGMGIPKEDLPRVFDRFYRVDKARSRETGGTGLGLSIVRQWVQNFGGAIQVDSVPGEKTVFTVTFPAEGGTAG